MKLESHGSEGIRRRYNLARVASWALGEDCKISDSAVSNVAVCEMVSEEMEAIADSFYASVDIGCASLERTSNHTDKKRTPRGTNCVETVSDDIVGFAVTNVRKCLNLDFFASFTRCRKGNMVGRFGS